jgi:hypothetical protein
MAQGFPETAGTSQQVVIPAEAGIHVDLILLIQEKNGFPLPRE